MDQIITNITLKENNSNKRQILKSLRSHFKTYVNRDNINLTIKDTKYNKQIYLRLIFWQIYLFPLTKYFFFQRLIMLDRVAEK